MWRWPSRTFWWIKTALFVIFLPVFCVSAVLTFWISGMGAFGPPRPAPDYLQVMGWLAVTPMRPSESFPTSEMLFNLIIALGVNAVVWSWVGSLAAAVIVEVIVRLVRRGRPAAT
jgi:hypothetical protein